MDFNIFEGRTVKGIPSHTISNGIVVWENGKLNTVKGAGRYIDRPPFNRYYDAVKKRIEATEPEKVNR